MVRVVLAESAFRVNGELFSPFSSSPVLRCRGEAARVLVAAGSDGGSLLRIYYVVLVRLR